MAFLLSLVHGVEVPYTCPTCKAVLKSEAEYSQHSRELHSAVAVCELCGKECSSRVIIVALQYFLRRLGSLQ